MKEEFTIPCAYQGGKSRLAKDIVDTILRDNPILLDESSTTKFYDLCCGSGAISIELIKRGVFPERIVMVDKSPFALFYKMMGNGTFSMDIFKFYIDSIPKDINKIQEYIKQLYKNPIKMNLVYEFLLLQASSFGSKAVWWENENNKWCTSSFRNYWLPTETSSRRSPVNPMMPMPSTLYNRVQILSEKMEEVIGIQDDINNIHIEENSILYIDPPYDKTSKYGFEFNYMNFIHKHKNNKIYLSEGNKLSDNAICLSTGRTKGGISGDRKKKANEEWLNIFN